MSDRTAWTVGIVALCLVAIQAFGGGEGQDFRSLYDAARIGDRLSMAGHLNLLCIPPFGPVFRAFGLWTLPLEFSESLAVFRIACLGAMAWVAWRCAAPFVLIVCALCPEYVWALKVGNITALQAPLVWIAVTMAGGPRSVASGFLFGAVSALKPSLLPMGLVWLMTGKRETLAMVLGFVIPTLACLLAIPGETLAGWWAGVSGLTANPFTFSPANISMPGLLFREWGLSFGGVPTPRQVSIVHGVTASILAMGAIAAFRYRRAGTETVAAIMACAAVLAGPASWYHYPTIMICALAVHPWRTGRAWAVAIVLTVLAMNGDGHLIGTGLAPWPTIALVLLFATWIAIAADAVKKVARP